MKKAKLSFKTIWNAGLGISLELALAYIFIFTGLAVCFIWWIIRK